VGHEHLFEIQLWSRRCPLDGDRHHCLGECHDPTFLRQCGGLEVPRIFMALTLRNFKSENHTGFNKLLVWL
jgi:hypothetical protein